MITPLFKVDQDEKFIYLNIKVKYVKFSDVEFFIEGNNFRLYLKPYYLNLNFSDNLKSDSENNNSKYDVDKGELECKIEKETAGVIFSNLDLISTLLQGNDNANNQTVANLSKKVEEISLNSNFIEINNAQANEPTIYSIHDKLNQEIFQSEDIDAFNEFLLNSLFNNACKPLEEDISLSSNIYDNHQSRYGFNNEFIDVFKHREEERIELLDLDPNKVELKHRYFAKMEKENEDFIPERYVYDELMLEMEDEGYVKMINKKFKKEASNTTSTAGTKINYNFSEKELSMLQSINKTKLSLLDVDKEIYFHFYLQAIDVLFAVLYDYRSTECEHNSESGWTINKLSALLSCCVDYNKLFFSFSSEPPMNYLEESVRNVLISSYRRTLCYPLYRSFKICRKIKDDLSELLSKGIFDILKFFLRVKSIFERSEPRHLLNKIYIDMFVKWLQFHSNENIWKVLAKVVNGIDIEKDELKLDLSEYEKEFEVDLKSEEGS